MINSILFSILQGALGRISVIATSEFVICFCLSIVCNVAVD